MNKVLNKTKKIGILGGGQLARMLALAAHPLGIQTQVLSENETDPAAQVTRLWQQGSPHSRKDLRRFLKKVDIITFESEFIDTDLLAELCIQENVRTYPAAKTIGRIQDRLSQKKLLTRYQLPTTDFINIRSFSDAEKALQKFESGVVFKQRRNGYDGYGTFIVKNQKQLENIRKILETSPTGFIAEAFIPFDREVAVIAARSLSGKVELMPFVESHQKDSRCFWVKGPLKETTAQKKMKSKIKNFLTKINYVGVMGIEFFEIDKELTINELAPRVHNTGHYSQNAFFEDQFTWHMKCVTGQELRAAAPKDGFSMVNLLSTGRQFSEATLRNPMKKDSAKDVALHWYGKDQARPGRKLGHLNSVAKTPEKALEIALKVAKGFHL